MPNAVKDHGLLLEAISRARNTVICVTFPGSSFHDLFDQAAQHKDAQSCDFGGRFISSPRVLVKDQVFHIPERSFLLKCFPKMELMEPK